MFTVQFDTYPYQVGPLGYIAVLVQPQDPCKAPSAMDPAGAKIRSTVGGGAFLSQAKLETVVDELNNKPWPQCGSGQDLTGVNR